MVYKYRLKYTVKNVKGKAKKSLTYFAQKEFNTKTDAEKKIKHVKKIYGKDFLKAKIS